MNVPDRIPRMIPPDGEIRWAVEILTHACYGVSWNSGWYHDPRTGEAIVRNVPEMLCLIHSEISEAMEGFRKTAMDDHLVDRHMFQVELCDAAIRIFDLLGHSAVAMGLDLPAAVFAEKVAYNISRADHKPDARTSEGGKKF